MRILVVTNLFPNPYQRGRATFNRQQVARLADEHHVVVIAPILWTDELIARKLSGDLLGADRRSAIGRIEVHHPTYYYPPKILRGWYGHCFLGSVREVFRRILREVRPEVVFAPWIYPDGWAAIELGHEAGLPVVIKAHGSDLLTLDLYPRRHRRTREALLDADAVVTVSRDLSDRAARLGADPARVRVVYDGIDPTIFHPGPQGEARDRLGLGRQERILLFVGNLVSVKGVDILIEAVERLASAGERFVCLLIGKGPLTSSLRHRVSQRRLDNFVRFLGPIEHDRLGDWFRAADFCVLPSRSEGVPIVLLECAACGKPFVASRTGGIPEIADLTPSLLVPPDDPVALAEALRRGLADQFPRLAHIRSPRSHDEAARELTELFRRVLEKRVG